ncbi:MAG: hypothetical protein AAGK78_17745 [Planctomycetota bacterium]
MGGVPGQPDNIVGSDCTAVDDGFISVTPLTVDLTNARALRGELADWTLDGYARRPGRQAPDKIDIRPLKK